MRRLVAPIVVLFLLGLAGGMQVLIDDAPERREALAERPFADLPADAVLVDYVGSQFLGSFRSLVVSALWGRVDRLKEEEQFDELRATTEMICRLQPHLAKMWDFNAYNLAYNISWQQEDREMRWKWIAEGLRLYEEGLRRNPRSTVLTFQLGYVYWHRVPQEEYLIRRVRETSGKETFEHAEHWIEKTRTMTMDQAREAGRPIDYLLNYQGSVIDNRYSLGLAYMGRAVKAARERDAAEARRLLGLAEKACLAASEMSFETSTYAPDPPFWRNRAAVYRDLVRTRTVLAPCLLDVTRAWVERLLADPGSAEARWPAEVLASARRVVLVWREYLTTPVQILAMQIVLDSLSEAFGAWEEGREEEAVRLIDERAAFCEAFHPDEGGWWVFARGIRSFKTALAKEKAARLAEQSGDRAAARIAREEARRIWSLFVETNLRLDVDRIRERLR